MRWTLDEVRALEVHETIELVTWLSDEAERAQHPGDSVDMDAMLAERRRGGE